MTLCFRPDMSACAFIVDGLCRYLKAHGGEEPAELVLHLKHKRALSREVRIPRDGVTYDACCFNDIPVIEDRCCLVP